MSVEVKPQGAALERTLHRDFYLSDALFGLERERISGGSGSAPAGRRSWRAPATTSPARSRGRAC